MANQVKPVETNRNNNGIINGKNLLSTMEEVGVQVSAQIKQAFEKGIIVA